MMNDEVNVAVKTHKVKKIKTLSALIVSLRSIQPLSVRNLILDLCCGPMILVGPLWSYSRVSE